MEGTCLLFLEDICWKFSLLSFRYAQNPLNENPLHQCKGVLFSRLGQNMLNLGFLDFKRFGISLLNKYTIVGFECFIRKKAPLKATLQK